MRSAEMLVFIIKLAAQDRQFSYPDTWSFTGTVIETRQVILLGKPAKVANILSKDFNVWVILHIGEKPFRVNLGDARPGDQVRVSIRGTHVSEKGIDWTLCSGTDTDTCQLGYLYDTGPLSPDWNLPMSPSNEFIHCDHPNQSWERALFWKTEKQILEEDKHPCSQPSCLPDSRDQHEVAAWCYAQAVYRFSLELRPMIKPIYLEWLKDRSRGELKSGTAEELYNWLKRMHPWSARSAYTEMLAEISWLLNATCDFFNYFHETTP